MRLRGDAQRTVVALDDEQGVPLHRAPQVAAVEREFDLGETAGLDPLLGPLSDRAAAGHTDAGDADGFVRVVVDPRGANHFGARRDIAEVDHLGGNRDGWLGDLAPVAGLRGDECRGDDDRQGHDEEADAGTQGAVHVRAVSRCRVRRNALQAYTADPRRRLRHPNSVHLGKTASARAESDVRELWPAKHPREDSNLRPSD